MEKERVHGRLAVDFTRGSIPRELFSFALPLCLANLLQITYQMADMAIVGQMTGPVGLTAVSVGGDVANFLLFVSMGFGGAGQVIIAQLLGARQEARLGRFVGNMVSLLLLVSAVFTVLCLALCETFLAWMQVPAEAAADAYAYATTTAAGLCFVYGYNALSAVLRGIGDARHPFCFIALSVCLNIAGDLLFVVLCGGGVRGAALATVLSQAASFFACAAFLYRARGRLGFAVAPRDFVLPDAALLRRLLLLGVPMAVKGAAISFSKLFVNSWVNSYGVTVAAFSGIANKLGSMSNLLSNAMNTAGSSMVGQNIGARCYARVTRILLVVAGAALAIAAVCSVCLLLFPESVFRLFTQDAQVIAVGLSYLPIGVLMFFGSAVRAPMNALINGSGNYQANFLTALLDGIVLRLGLAVLFGLALGMGYKGFWLGDALSGFTPLFIGGALYISGLWRRGADEKRQAARNE